MLAEWASSTPSSRARSGMISATGMEPGIPRSARRVPDVTDNLTSDVAVLWLTSVVLPDGAYVCGPRRDGERTRA